MQFFWGLGFISIIFSEFLFCMFGFDGEKRDYGEVEGFFALEVWML